MNSAQLEQLESLYFEAIELPVDQWDAFCDRRCAADPLIEEKLRAMLATERDAAQSKQFAPTIDFARERQFSAYHVVRTIARGGMGSVYEAIEPAPLSRRVALKVLRIDLESQVALDRFRTECSILARLDHPGIPRILDAGTIDTGRPWFAMEFVDGVPIDRFLAEYRPSFDERMRLFFDACVAVSYAHANAALHLDLKPSNVLITDCAGARPRVKVIDFGIGLDLDHDGRISERAPVGSMDTMSPEQADAGRPPLDARADVYALAVMLHHVLADAPAFDRKNTGPAAAELSEVIRQTGRRRLVDVVVAELDVPEGLLDALDAVVDRGTAVCPEDRYGDVDALAAATHRALRHAARRDVRASGVIAHLWSRRGWRAAAFGGVVIVAVGWAVRPIMESRDERSAVVAAGDRSVEAGLLSQAVDFAVFLQAKRTAVTPDERGRLRAFAAVAASERGSKDAGQRAVLRQLLGRAAARVAMPRLAETLLHGALLGRIAAPDTARSAMEEAVLDLAALRADLDTLVVDDLAVMAVQLPRIGDRYGEIAGSLSVFTSTNDSATAAEAFEDLVEALRAAALPDRVREAVADLLWTAYEHHLAMGAHPVAPIARLEIEQRIRIHAPHDERLVRARARLVDAALVEGAPDPAIAIAAELELIDSAAAASTAQPHRLALVRSVRAAQMRLAGADAGAARREFERASQAFGQGDTNSPAELRRHRLRWLLTGPTAEDADVRDSYARDLIAAERQPGRWLLREPAFARSDADLCSRLRAFERDHVREMSASDPARVTALAQLLRAVDAAVEPGDGRQELLAQQFTEWCRFTSTVSPEVRVALATAAIELARSGGGDAASASLRRARIQLASAYAYAGRHVDVVATARAAIESTDVDRTFTVDGLYPRSLLVEALLASGAVDEAKREAAELVRHARLSLIPTHPFVGYVEELAFERVGVKLPE